MTEDQYQVQLGARLRAIRAQQGLTLQDVEQRSDGQWKAVVIGAYERGDRAVSIAKLADLGRFYGVPLADLLPRPAPDGDTSEPEREQRLVLDLTKLDADDIHDAHDPRLSGVRRYARRIQIQRGDYNGQVLTLRGDDLEALAAVFDTETGDLVAALDHRDALRAR